ncbi:MAG TPA: hypothetical protein VMT52_08205 [Planctomycetota bacterium]|nr:hypothetical protein [Planctomycetota bacterium]
MDRRETGALLELSVARIPLDGADALEAWVFQASDRPDRLEVSLAVDEDRAPPFAADPARGVPVSASILGFSVFDGRLERVVHSLDPARGTVLRLIACAHYHFLRPSWPGGLLPHTTDAEAAARIAIFLDLVPVVSRLDDVHAALDASGDPLVFLRRRARAVGFDLAVTAGRLYFKRELPPVDGVVRLDRTSGVVALDLAETLLGTDGAGRRTAEVEVHGDPRLRPLVRVELRGLGVRADGWYRVKRAVHSLGVTGPWTKAWLVEERTALPRSRWRAMETLGGECS